ncbi:cysteine-rich motor neuron 1 protein-like [Megalops cyprinoides]|uniref:cysteine-rich motor neuron 1 protein-like n=1 Tax=Megalops cyprinoides TaxID=118141 RepID=UPI0018650E93|nr:cysteine-rich motor neuron 1 protein-like [Megalops cyprinoides]
MAPPACGAMNNCTLTAEDCSIGFEKDQNGCNTCRCKTREEEHGGQLADCGLSCPLGYQTDEQGCRMCLCRTQPEECKSEACGKQCPHGFRKNKHGCDLCSCKKCPELSCDLACPAGFAQDDSGCLICHCKDPPALSITPSVARSEPCLSVDGRRHGDGESWHDGCRDCYCHNGREMCAVIFCRVPACANPSIPPGQCCPSCTDEIISRKPEPSESLACPDSGGRRVSEGEGWRLDSCSQCTCQSGQTMCETEVCPPAPCQDPVRTPDSCCPRCPGEPLTPLSPGNTGSAPNYCEGEDGAVFLSGESWRPDACSSCVCLDGGVACYSELCSALGCARPVLRKGQCCPSCAENNMGNAALRLHQMNKYRHSH